MSRYTAEFRGGDNDDDPEEWCIIDECLGPVGGVVAFGLGKGEAIKLADEMNMAVNKDE